jgi:drug/metabolite transporter (DMT)-like permease
MTPLAIALVLAAALLHATWNAVLRSGADRLWSIAVMGIASGSTALPFALALPLPAPASWPYLLLSAVLQIGYSLFLVLAYRRGDFGQVYPIARGSAPLLVTLGAALFARELPSAAALAGIALVSLGILSLAYAGRHAPPIALGAALTTGLFIAAYGVTDGIGSRLSGAPIAYAAWLNVLYTPVMLVIVVAVRGRFALDPSAPETLKAALSGVLALVGYAVIMWAVTLAPMGAVSALRETSVVFAALIGRLFLEERLTLRRVGSCAVIAIGAICLTWR